MRDPGFAASAGKIQKDVVIISDPEQLPDEWDALFKENLIYNSKIFLEHLHLMNRIPQKYFYIRHHDRISLAGSLYRTKLPFCLGPIYLSAPVSVCGIPMIYGSQPGFAPLSAVREAAGVMDRAWAGFQWVVGLNCRPQDIPGWSWRRQLVTVDLKIRWTSYAEYLNDFRSGYRYKVNKIIENGAGLERRLFKSPQFTRQAYQQYTDLASSPKYRQDVLSQSFFTGFPLEHDYLALYCNKELMGWALLVPHQGELFFLFCGLEQKNNIRKSIYKNLLLKMVEYAIDNGYRVLHLGQTAELAKMLIGGMPEERYILVRHTNSVMNELIKRTDIFTFRKQYPPLKVFKSR